MHTTDIKFLNRLASLNYVTNIVKLSNLHSRGGRLNLTLTAVYQCICVSVKPSYL